jgi:transposase
VRTRVPVDAVNGVVADPPGSGPSAQTYTAVSPDAAFTVRTHTAAGARIEEQIAPFAAAVRQLDEVTGISLAAAHAIIAEIGLDMARFPTAGHLVSWAKYAPGVKEPAGKKKGKLHRPRQLLPGPDPGQHRRGRREDRHLPRRALPADRPPPRAKKANVAIGRSIPVVIWHLLSDPQARYTDLGAGFCATRTDPERRRRNHVRQLEALGYTVILERAA